MNLSNKFATVFDLIKSKYNNNSNTKNTMSSFDRLSYLQSNEYSHQNELSSLVNPCKNLVLDFNSVLDEEVFSDHLKVYLRIRPLLSEESITNQDGNVEVLNNKKILLTAPSGSHAFKTKPQGSNKVSHNFTFSHVYGQDTCQNTLFEETTQNLVQDLVNGQNCLLFTYGATNSGKTYTIQGTPANVGLLPRTLDTLFSLVGEQQYPGNDLKPMHFSEVVRMSEKQWLKEEETRNNLLNMGSVSLTSMSHSTCSLESATSKLTDVGCASDFTLDEENEIPTVIPQSNESTASSADSQKAIYAIFVSFAEIYNEYIYDLLERSTLTKQIKKNPLSLGEDKNGAIYIKGLKEVRIKSAEEALKILEVGKQNLHFAATKLNHASSRSHCIFTVKLIQLADPLHPHIARVTILSLCDLAGAERTGKTLNSMDRLKEASNINTSLLVLGRCMTALRHNQLVSKQVCGPKKKSQVPYRDSKVTRIFQSFFMGKGKVAMIVNISLSSLLFDETLKVLKFSALASKVLITQDKCISNESFVESYKSNNRFSRFVRQSLNMTTKSSRFSVPWSDKSYTDVTFGEASERESGLMGVLAEEEEEDEEDDKTQALLDLITKLKDRLLKECKEKEALEKKLRKDICDMFSKKIVQIEETWESRLSEERARKEELMERRLNHVLDGMEEKSSRKRLREEEVHDSDQEMVPALYLVREEVKVRDLEEEKSHLEAELKAVLASLKASNRAIKSTQEENSKLVFELAQNNRLMEELRQQKANMERKQRENSVAEVSRATIDHVVVEELQHKIGVLEAVAKEKDEELMNVKKMLTEAAEAFYLKDQQITNLKQSLLASKEENSKQAFEVADLECQVSETKAMLDSQRRNFEDREQELDELRDQLHLEESSSSITKNPNKDLAKIRDASIQDDILESEVKSLKDAFLEIERQLEEERKICKHLLAEKAKLEVDIEEMGIKSSVTINEVEKKNEELQTEMCELKRLLYTSEKELKESARAEDETIDELKFKISELELEMSEIQENYNNSKETVKEFEDKIKEYTEQIEISEKCNDNLTKEIEKLKNENEGLITEQEILIEKAIHSENKNGKENELLNEIELLKKQIKNKEKEYEEIEEELNEIKMENEASLEQSQKLTQTLESKQRQEMLLLTEVNDLTRQNEELTKEQKKEQHNNTEQILRLQSQLKEKTEAFYIFESKSEALKRALVEAEKKLLAVDTREHEFMKVKSTYEHQIQNLLSKVEEKEALISKLNSKTETLDRKLNNAEEEIEPLKSKCQVVEKELAAIREARTEEVGQLTAESESKDNDITTLQLELKRLLHITTSEVLEKSKTTAAVKDEPKSNEEVEKLHETLRVTESEKSELMVRVSSLEHELENWRIQTQTNSSTASQKKQCGSRKKDSYHSPTIDSISTVPKVRFDSSSCVNSEASDCSSKKTSATRCTRATRKKDDSTVPDANNRLTANTSVGEDSASTANETHTAKNNQKKQPQNVSDFKVPSTRKKRPPDLRFQLDEDTDSVDEEDEDDVYDPRTRKTSSKKSGGPAKTPRARKKSQQKSQLFNPHIENNENIDVSNISDLRNQSLAGSGKVTSGPATRSSRRRRRPLYNQDPDEQFNCSPDLLTNPRANELSPHSTVLRKLRSKK